MLTREDETLAAAVKWREQGRGVAIATVVETWGSAPRPGRLASRHRRGPGNFLGSVSGGCVEGAVVEEALDVIASGAAKDAGIRRRRRDGLAGRPLLRRPHQSLCRKGGRMKLEHLEGAESRAARAARRGARHKARPTASSALSWRPASPPIRSPTPLEAALRTGKSADNRARGRELLSHRASAAAAGSSSSAPCISPGAGADRANRRLRRDHRRSAHRLRHARSAFPT